MNRILILAILFQLFSPVISAVETTEHHDGPCSKLMEACKAAGYNKSNLKDKKSLSKDCMQPLLNDQKVANVKIEEDIVKACKEKKAELKSKK